MSSWFQGAKGAGADLLSNINLSLPDNLVKTIQDISLNSDEMKAEREQLKIEEEVKKAKKEIAFSDNLLPWETRSEEHCILCQECKEMILKFSLSEDTFMGPYLADEANQATPSSGILLPEDFDVEIYLGVIQRVLEIDHNLKDMHSHIIGEDLTSDVAFWKNYFHHCALARIEIGLDNDEIWIHSNVYNSTQKSSPIIQDEESAHEEVVPVVEKDNQPTSEGVESVASEEITFASPVKCEENSVVSQDENILQKKDVKDSDSADFVTVSDTDLNDLDAEIAAALED